MGILSTFDLFPGIMSSYKLTLCELYTLMVLEAVRVISLKSFKSILACHLDNKSSPISPSK